MAKTITIPSDQGNPVVVVLNGKKYIYTAGETVSVPNEVAALLQANAGNAVIYGRRATAPLEAAGLYEGSDYIPLYVTADGGLRIKKSDITALIPAQELPEIPEEDGTYALSLTVNDGEAALSWEAAEAAASESEPS